MPLEPAFHDLISGRTVGRAAACARGVLSAASAVYGRAVAVRTRAYDDGRRRVYHAGVPVISVGNLTAGGTGKTPVVAHLCGDLRRRGYRPAVLSRGYRAGADDATAGGPGNDEKRLLEARLPGLPHVQNPDRVAGATVAVREYAADVLVLDDGFQHRRLHRDLDLVLIDATRPFGHDRLLPRGLLREPITALSRAHAVLLTRSDQLDPEGLLELVERVRTVRADLPIVPVNFPPLDLTGRGGKSLPPATVRGRRVTAFCGIGNPDGFRATLLDLGCDIAAFTPYPDHHHFTAAEIDRERARAADTGAGMVLCTEKDWVKLHRWTTGDAASGRSRQSPVPVRAVRIGIDFPAGRGVLDRLLAPLVPGTPTPRRRAA